MAFIRVITLQKIVADKVIRPRHLTTNLIILKHLALLNIRQPIAIPSVYKIPSSKKTFN